MAAVDVVSGFLTPREAAACRLLCEEALDSVHARVGRDRTRGRSRVRRWGYSYGKRGRPPKPAEPWPGWVEDLRMQVDLVLRRGISDAVTLNEYPPGHAIAPHVDSSWFESEVGVLSIGSCVFSTYEGESNAPSATFHPSDGALVVMRGAVRHACEATGPNARYSLVFRRRRRDVPS